MHHRLNASNPRLVAKWSELADSPPIWRNRLAMLLAMGSSHRLPTRVFFTLLLVLCLTPTPLHAGDERCKTVLLEALQAHGGEQKLRASRTVQEASGYRNEL